MVESFVRSALCEEFWEGKRHLEILEDAKNQRKLHNAAWTGQRKETMNSIMDVSNLVGIEMAKEFKKKISAVGEKERDRFEKNDLPKFAAETKAMYNYELQEEDICLLMEYLSDKIKVEVYTLQNMGVENICNLIPLPEASIKGIREKTIRMELYVREEIYIEEFTERIIRDVYDLLRKNEVSMDVILRIAEPVLDLEDIKELADIKESSGQEIEDFIQRLTIKNMLPLALFHQDPDPDRTDIDVKKVQYFRNLVYGNR